jgi:phytoene dehydrogenase-like protein
MGDSYDAVIVGAGPNGLAAAITFARAGLKVLVLESKDTPGGGCRTAEITLPGFHHDVCAAIHPIGIVSPFFRELPMARFGLEWVKCPRPLAHPLPGGGAAVLAHSLEETARGLGEDGPAWMKLMRPFVEQASQLFEEILRPIRFPSRPWLMARFGLTALQSCERLVKARFRGHAARALFGGCAAHSFLPLDAAASASFGLVLALAGHAVDWPCAKGGSQRVIDAMAACLRELGGTIYTGVHVRTLKDIPPSRVVLFDLTPRQIVAIAGDSLPARYRRQLERFRYGPGVFKIDWALNAPIPWRNHECLEAGTVHVGGAYESIAAAEACAWRGEIASEPFVLVAQQSVFDRTRAPAGKHTGWAYCHVPAGCTVDMTERMEAQIERFAPGFKDTILARHTMSPADVEKHNANMIGGDIGGGANTLAQFLFRPVPRWDPYATPNRRLFICSSSTPPGGGVHGMCGYGAAQSALRRVFGKQE